MYPILHVSPLINPADTASDTMAPRLQRLHLAMRGAPVHERVEAWSEAARGWVDMGAPGAAEAHYEQALCWAELLGAADTVVQLLCEVAELTACLAERQEREQARAGRPARRRARAYAQQAAARASAVSDSNWEIVVLLRISDVLDRCGNRDDAVELQERAVRMMALRTLA